MSTVTRLSCDQLVIQLANLGDTIKSPCTVTTCMHATSLYCTSIEIAIECELLVKIGFGRYLFKYVELRKSELRMKMN